MARTHTITSQEIIRDMHRVAEKNGGILNVALYRDSGIFSMLTMQRTLGLPDSRQGTIMQVVQENEKPEINYSYRTTKMLVRKFAKHFTKKRYEAEIAGNEKAKKWWAFTPENFEREAKLGIKEVTSAISGEGATWDEVLMDAGVRNL